MSQPTISVGVPTINSEKRIVECLDNLLGQTFTDFEIIISDNASTDGTYEICNSYADNNPNIRLYRQEQQLSMRDNFYYLVEKATAPYFHWRSDDDLSNPEFLASLHSQFSDSSVVLSGGNVERIRVINNKTMPRAGSKYVPQDDPVARIKHMFIDKDKFFVCDWFHGLWRRDYLLETIERIWNSHDCDKLWATDNLTVLPAILNNRFAYSPQAKYVKRSIRDQRLHRNLLTVEEKLRTRVSLFEQCKEIYRNEVESLSNRSTPPL